MQQHFIHMALLHFRSARYAYAYRKLISADTSVVAKFQVIKHTAAMFLRNWTAQKNRVHGVNNPLPPANYIQNYVQNFLHL
jgi:hypothetical protein